MYDSGEANMGIWGFGGWNGEESREKQFECVNGSRMFKNTTVFIRKCWWNSVNKLGDRLGLTCGFEFGEDARGY
jgi:hypothetical protein